MSARLEASNVVIRDIERHAEMRAVEELQKEVWGVPDLDVVPVTQLVAARAAGGVLLGAFDGGSLAGFIYGFPSLEHGQPAHHSHMLAVKPSYRNHDLGRRLKLAQREYVVGQGVLLMTWTFDPLQSLNAYFNFSKLGVLSDLYLLNFYGEDASSYLHQLGTDRLWVSWLLSSDRAQRKIHGRGDDRSPEVEHPLIRVAADDSPERSEIGECMTSDFAAIEVPANINALQQNQPEVGRRWREESRWAFTELINGGYVVTGFERLTRGDHRLGRYILRKGKLRQLAGCNTW